MHLRMKIAADGTVCAVDIVRNELSDAVGTCVAEVFAAPLNADTRRTRGATPLHRE